MKKFFLTLSLCLFAVTAFAQTTVTGTVSDEKGEPLPSAAILAGGDYAVTDLNGHFSLTTKPGATVTVSYLGFEDYVFTAAAGISPLNIRMTPSQALMLDETVVIGYGTTTKKETTGSRSGSRSQA